ncbi:hypothetical protein BJY04DRAFT_187664, partial [Aspergillus karnatakaensis]|uniref:uncharacterized protein n=1 Tax=Aspergillus karnatakaensis TaxID=1810916 RepID=UPI003CCD5078
MLCIDSGNNNSYMYEKEQGYRIAVLPLHHPSIHPCPTPLLSSSQQDEELRIKQSATHPPPTATHSTQTDTAPPPTQHSNPHNDNTASTRATDPQTPPAHQAHRHSHGSPAASSRHSHSDTSGLLDQPVPVSQYPAVE